MTRILIADDHFIVRAGLRALLKSEPAFELVGEANGGHEALDLVQRTRPDVLILDLSMPDLDGIAITRKLKPEFPALRILILTLHEDQALLKGAIKAGASGYILKRAVEVELIAAIHAVLRGDLYLDPALTRGLLDEPAPPARPPSASIKSLTPRETEVLQLLAEGYTNRQIGERLSLSVRTVEGHRSNLSDKLGLRSRVEFVRYAREHGLIQ
jgi:two-component system, NarL family, response regulator NreC